MQFMIRKLKLKRDRGLSDVFIQIGWPVEDKTSWSCSWEIRWPDRTRSNDAHGVDAIQSLMVAFQLVGVELYCSEEHKAGTLSWDGWIGYGFPVPNSLRDLLIGDDLKSF